MGNSRARINRRKVTKYLNIAKFTQGVSLLYLHLIFAMITMHGSLVNIRSGGIEQQKGMFFLHLFIFKAAMI